MKEECHKVRVSNRSGTGRSNVCCRGKNPDSGSREPGFES